MEVVGSPPAVVVSPPGHGLPSAAARRFAKQRRRAPPRVPEVSSSPGRELALPQALRQANAQSPEAFHPCGPAESPPMVTTGGSPVRQGLGEELAPAVCAEPSLPSPPSGLGAGVRAVSEEVHEAVVEVDVVRVGAAEDVAVGAAEDAATDVDSAVEMATRSVAGTNLALDASPKSAAPEAPHSSGPPTPPDTLYSEDWSSADGGSAGGQHSLPAGSESEDDGDAGAGGDASSEEEEEGVRAPAVVEPDSDYDGEEMPKLYIDLTRSKYRVVRRAAKKLEWKVNSKKANIKWLDAWTADDLMRLDVVKSNHFPGTKEVCNKASLARHLNRMQKSFPRAYNFFPPTWVLPADRDRLNSYYKPYATPKTTLPVLPSTPKTGTRPPAAPKSSRRAGTAASPKTRKAKAASKKAAGRPPRRIIPPMFIVKPDAMCQGRGIYIAKTPDSIEDALGSLSVVQKYLRNPLLIDGHKFDLRLYVLVNSAAPTFRVFLHREGLARFCTEPYAPPTEANMENMCMHLTNFAINRKNGGGGPKSTTIGKRGAPPPKPAAGAGASDDDLSSEPDITAGAAEPDSDAESRRGGDASSVASDSDRSSTWSPEGEYTPSDPVLHQTKGFKWSLTALFAVLRKRGVDVTQLWKRICGVVIKTMLSIKPRVAHLYRSSRGHNRMSTVVEEEEEQGFMVYEVLGFDIVLDSKMKPYLLEVNQSPSFETSTKLDRVIKEEVMTDSFALSCVDEEWLLSHACDLLPGEGPSDDESEPTSPPKASPPRAASVAKSIGPGRLRALKPTPSASVDADATPAMSPYCRWILRLRTEYENRHCGRYVRLLPIEPGAPNPYAAIEADIPSSLRQTASMRKRQLEALEQRRELSRQKSGGRPAPRV